MKDLLKYLLVCLVSIFSLNSCREDGDWGNNNEGIFGFTIERDTDYIEKAVGEINQLKFNIKTKYDFASVPMKIKYTTSLDGVLKLDGKILEANKEYVLASAENILEYVGNEAGSHQLKISVKNDKGNSAVEEYDLKYGVSDFVHTFTGGNGTIYQNEEELYVMKIASSNKNTNKDYQIKFNSYAGNIKLDEMKVEINKWYDIINIDRFIVSLKNSKYGQSKLTYTIKNKTVSRDYEIQQTITKKEIQISDISINFEDIVIGNSLQISGIIKKMPITNNTQVEYKTWISTSSNGDLSGISTTNNIYMPYDLGVNNVFDLKFKTIKEGKYKYNIQFRDENGNETEVKSFDINVEDKLKFVYEPTFKVHIEELFIRGALSSYFFREYIRDLHLKSNGDGRIMKVEYKLSFVRTQVDTKIKDTVSFTFEDTYPQGITEIHFPSQRVAVSSNHDIDWVLTVPSSRAGLKFDNGQFEIKVTMNDGKIHKKVVSTPIEVKQKFS